MPFTDPHRQADPERPAWVRRFTLVAGVVFVGLLLALFAGLVVGLWTAILL